jgi:hypothetical protein
MSVFKKNSAEIEFFEFKKSNYKSLNIFFKYLNKKFVGNVYNKDLINIISNEIKSYINYLSIKSKEYFCTKTDLNYFEFIGISKKEIGLLNEFLNINNMIKTTIGYSYVDAILERLKIDK